MRSGIASGLWAAAGITHAVRSSAHASCPYGWRWGTTPLQSIAGTSHARAGRKHRQTGEEPSIWIGYGVLDRKITYPKEQFLSRTEGPIQNAHHRQPSHRNDWAQQVRCPHSASGIVRPQRADASRHRLVAHTKKKRPNKTACVLAYGYFITI